MVAAGETLRPLPALSTAQHPSFDPHASSCTSHSEVADPQTVLRLLTEALDAFDEPGARGGRLVHVAHGVELTSSSSPIPYTVASPSQRSLASLRSGAQLLRNRAQQLRSSPHDSVQRGGSRLDGSHLPNKQHLDIPHQLNTISAECLADRTAGRTSAVTSPVPSVPLAHNAVGSPYQHMPLAALPAILDVAAPELAPVGRLPTAVQADSGDAPSPLARALTPSAAQCLAASPLLRGGSDTYSDTLPVPQQGGQAPQSVGIKLAIPELPKPVPKPLPKPLPKPVGEVCATAKPVGGLTAPTCPAKPVGKPDGLMNTHHTHAAARPHDPGWGIVHSSHGMISSYRLIPAMACLVPLIGQGGCAVTDTHG